MAVVTEHHNLGARENDFRMMIYICKTLAASFSSEE